MVIASRPSNGRVPGDDSSVPLAENARVVLERRYLAKDSQGEIIETPEQLFRRVAHNLAQAESNYGADSARLAEVENHFYQVMTQLDFLPNSPTLGNAGRPLQQLSACFVLPVPDSIEGIFDTIKYTALIHQSGGGCIAGDARVWTTFCGIEPIEVLVNRATADGRAGVRHGAGIAYDVRDLGVETVSMDPDTGETGLRRVSHVWRFAVPPENQLVVTMRERTTIQTSDWHPFMVVRGTRLAEVKAADLRPGDVVLGPERPDAYWPWTAARKVGDLTIDPELGWLIGFTLGDGSFGYVRALRQFRVRWFSGTSDVLERVQSILARHGIAVSIQRDGRGLLSVSTLTQRFVHDLLEACGLEKFGPKDDLIRVPEVIAKSPLPVVRAFIAGLLDSDGFVDRDGSPSYSTVSEAMAEDVAALLSLMGYQPTLRAKAPRGKGRRATHTVLLCALPAVNDLCHDLAPHLANKLRRDRMQSGSRRRSALRLPFREWRDRLGSLDLVKSRGDKIGGPGPCAAELNRWSCNEGGRCRRDDLLAIGRLVESYDPEFARFLTRLATSGQEVETVARATIAKPYYDLTVDGWNTYAAGRSGLAMIHNTGFAFSRLRPEGSMVASTAGVASGPVSFMKVFDGATEAIKQGGSRRGANMGILIVDHPDIEKFIEVKSDMTSLTNFNISVAVTEKFLHAVERDEEYDLWDPHEQKVTGHKRAREIWEKLVYNAWKNGDPGLVFIDRINEANPVPQWGPIESTNPCVTGETLIYTGSGLRRAAEIAAENIPLRVVVDGEPRFAVSSPVFYTGRKPVFRLHTAEGYALRLTADHRVLTRRGWVAARDLRDGDRVRLLSHEGGFGSGGTLALGRLLGWLVGDGTFAGDRAVLSFFGDEKRELAPRFAEMMAETVPAPAGFRQDYPLGVLNVTGRDEARVASARFARIAEAYGLRQGDKHKVPEGVLTGSEEMQRGFLQALFTADGHVAGGVDKGISVRLTSISRSLLQDVQRLLLNFGVASAIYSDRRAGGPRRLPDGHGGYRDYQTSAYDDLVIAKDNLLRFASEIGFLSQAKQSALVSRLSLYHRGPYKESFYARFTALVRDGEEDVYDLTEPQTHSFVANGLVVHNCGEQALGPYDSCNLGSLNLANFAVRRTNGWQVDWDRLGSVIPIAIRLLDDVIDMNRFPIEPIAEMSRQNRRVGLGLMGFADLLMKLGVPYNSEEAVQWAERIMQFIESRANAASLQLGEERGVFPAWEGSVYNTRPDLYPDKPRYRNCTRTTIAPTGTLSIIANCSSGIEPVFALAFMRQHFLDRKEAKKPTQLTEVNEYFLKIAQEQGFYSEDLMSFLAQGGRLVERIDVPDDVKRVFVTAHDVEPEWHVRIQAAFQRHVDNGVSKTINFPHGATPADVEKAYLLAYHEGCKGITIYRDGSRDMQVLSHQGAQKTDQSGEMTTAQVLAQPVPAEPPAPRRKRLPDERQSLTHKFRVGDQEGYLTVGLYEDGSPGELFIRVSKQGSTVSGLMETLGLLTSLALQHGVPLETLTNKLKGTRFEPSGMTDHPEIRTATSLVDYIARYLEYKYLDGGDQDHAQLPLWKGKVELLDVVPSQAMQTGMACPECGSLLHFAEGCLICRGCGYSKCG